jgi:hypothetical protein
MVRIVALLLGLVAIAFAAKYALEGGVGRSSQSQTEPKRQLDNVRAKTKEFEREEQKHIDDALKKAGAAEHE